MKLSTFSNHSSLKFNSLFFLGILVFYPLREAFSIKLGPQSFFRFGDAFIFLAPIFCFLLKLKGQSFKICYAMGLFLLYVIVAGVLFGEIVNFSYAQNFIIRAVFVSCFIFVCEHIVIDSSIRLFDKFFKYVVLLELCFCIIQLCGFNFFGLHFSSFNPEAVWGVRRLNGTASEPGYLVPVLVPCLYYFFINRKKNTMYFLLVCLEFLFTFSSFAYIIFLLTLGYAIAQTKKKWGNFFIPIAFLTMFLFALFTFVPQLNLIQQNVQGKIIAYIVEDESKMDWSAAERAENKKVATRAFKNMSIEKKLFGMGLGATQYYTEHGVKYHYASNEAANAYLALLLNVGIVGLFLFFCIMYKVYKLKYDNTISKTFYWALVVQLFQYTITGNIWMYLTWFNIGLLIIVRRNDPYLLRTDKG